MDRKCIYGFASSLFLLGCGGGGSENGASANSGVGNSGDIEIKLESKTFTSINNRIEGQLPLTLSDNVSASDLIFTFDENALADAELTIESDGRFVLSSEPYADEMSLDISVTHNGATQTATMLFKTQELNNLADDADPFYAEQWHLNNTGQDAFASNVGSTGMDINIGELHHQDITGKNVHVAIVDSGLEIAHEDIKDNVIPNASYDFIDDDNDPSPSEFDFRADHGTSVAGLTASIADNNLGGRGVAPNASISGFNFLESQSLYAYVQTHGGEKTQSANVINQSYGISANFLLPTNIFNFDIQDAFLTDYFSTHSNPALMIKSAGNGYEYLGNYYKYNPSDEEKRLPAQIANSDPENASFYNTVVSALGANETTPLSSYSTTGSAVLFSAPGGEYGQDNPAMITIDRQGCDRGYSQSSGAGTYTGGLTNDLQIDTNCSYTSQFNGTSSAAPVASGVAALVMQANPALTWRDVRYIMAKTASKIDTNFEPIVLSRGNDRYIAETNWTENTAGNLYHNWYGYGRLNATKAVQMATRNYNLLPELEISDFISANISSPITIPENLIGVNQQITVTDDINIEAVQLQLDINHDRFGDLSIEVISPSGTRSIVATARNLHLINPHWILDEPNLLFLSHAFLDEPSRGTWTIRIVDTDNASIDLYDLSTRSSFEYENNASLGQLNRAELKIFGHRKG